MNNARYEKSPRLQRVAAYLQDGQPHSTMDIITNACVCAVNSIVSELRLNGFEIDCWRSNNAWYYRLR